MKDKQIIINGFNLEYIKELLYNGQRSAITTNIFEAIIEELERKEQECEELKQTLAEIKKIAEPFCETCQIFEPEKKDRNNIYCIFCNYGKILQKISEVE